MKYELDELKALIDTNPYKVDVLSALRSFADELERISEYQKFLHEIIPMNFKKVAPNQDENPYFTLDEVKNNSDLMAAAKGRMKKFLEKAESK